MTVKKVKVVGPKIAYLGFDIVDGYIDDFGYCRTEKGAKDTYKYYLKVENWPDPGDQPPGKLVGTIKL